MGNNLGKPKLKLGTAAFQSKSGTNLINDCGHKDENKRPVELNRNYICVQLHQEKQTESTVIALFMRF